jgi:hypothetical protein
MLLVIQAPNEKQMNEIRETRNVQKSKVQNVEVSDTTKDEKEIKLATRPYKNIFANI